MNERYRMASRYRHAIRFAGKFFFPEWRLQEYHPNYSDSLRNVHAGSPYGDFAPDWIQSSSTGLILAI